MNSWWRLRTGVDPERGSVTRNSTASRNECFKDFRVLNFGHCCGSQSRAPLVSAAVAV